MWTDHTPPVDSHEFLHSVSALLSVPLVTGGTVKLLNNGDAWLEAMLADFAAAEHSISFSVYTWEPGELSDIIFETLVARARAGVSVRVLIDAVGGKSCPNEDIERLRDASGQVCVFRPLKVGKVDHFHLRNHRRAIVIDGRIGYTGGMAVSDQWLGDARNEREWRDIMVRVTGPIAQNVQSAFAELWAYVCGEVLSGPHYFPADTDDKSNIRSIGVVSSPASEEQPLHLFFFKTFMSARKRLWITTPYFIVPKSTQEQLISRAEAGVDVRIMLPSHHTDAKSVRRAGQGAFEKLLEAGVRIFEYQPTMVHSKAIVVDSIWSIVGSANMDIRSAELNEENVLGILDPQLAYDLEQAFQRDMERAVEIDKEEWRRRGLAQRALERVSGLLSEQY